MNFRRRGRIASEVSTSSLNDIMFFLLLFFLITSTLVNPNVIPLNLPNATGERRVQAKKNITVSIDEGRKYYINRQPYDAENIQAGLKAVFDANPNAEPVVLLNADETVPVSDVVTVMRAGRALNAKVLLAVKDE